MYVLRSTASGLTSTGSQVWTLPKLGAPTGTTDWLGEWLVAGNVGNGTAGDLVIGSYGTTNDAPPTPAYLLYGSTGGLGQVETLEKGRGAMADFDGDGDADLASVAGATETSRLAS